MKCYLGSCCFLPKVNNVFVSLCLLIFNPSNTIFCFFVDRACTQHHLLLSIIVVYCLHECICLPLVQYITFFIKYITNCIYFCVSSIHEIICSMYLAILFSCLFPLHMNLLGDSQLSSDMLECFINKKPTSFYKV